MSELEKINNIKEIITDVNDMQKKDLAKTNDSFHRSILAAQIGSLDLVLNIIEKQMKE